MNNLSREDLVRIVQRIQDAAGTADEQDQLIETLVNNVIDPNVTDYIFWSKPELSADEIVDKALAYKAIQL